MSRWDIFRWRTLAGGPPCRQGRQRFSHQAFLSNRPKRVPPFVLTCRFGRRRALPTGELRHKRRRGDTELCGALASCPLSRLAATASRLPPRSSAGRCPPGTSAPRHL